MVIQPLPTRLIKLNFYFLTRSGQRMLQERRTFRRILKTVPGCYTSLIARMLWLWACARSWPHYVTLVSAPFFFFTQKSISAGKSGRPKLFCPYNAIRDGRLATTLTLQNLRMTTRYVKCLLNFSQVASGFVGLRVREEAARQPRQAKTQIDLRNSVSSEWITVK